MAGGRTPCVHRRPRSVDSAAQQHNDASAATTAAVDRYLYYLSLVCHLALLIAYRGAAIVHLPAVWTFPFGWILAFPAAPSGKRGAPRLGRRRRPAKASSTWPARSNRDGPQAR